MIASPSDIPVARDTAYRALSRWNEANSRERSVVLVPLRWETGAVPVLGDDAQTLINRQLVQNSDIVIALFGSRLGAATPTAISGTAAEIQEAVDGGKPVHLYFSTAPHPNDVDPEQLIALRDFRAELEHAGLVGTFANEEELTAHIWQAVGYDIAQLGLSGELNVKSGAVEVLLQGGSERTTESDSRGRLKSRLHRWVDVINRGSEDAANVTVEPLGEGIFLGRTERPRTIHAGQSQRFPYELSIAADADGQFRVSWDEGGERHSRDFDV